MPAGVAPKGLEGPAPRFHVKPPIRPGPKTGARSQGSSLAKQDAAAPRPPSLEGFT
jgi:hypothetical protein